MISLSYLFELLGDPKWTERLRNRATEYSDSAYKNRADRKSHGQLGLMADRASELAKRNDRYNNLRAEDKEALRQGNRLFPSGMQYKYHTKDDYHKMTDELYPHRVSKRRFNLQSKETRKEFDTITNRIKAQNEARTNAKALLPKSLQK